MLDNIRPLKIDGPGSIVIRKAVREDLPRMQEIFALARKFMAETGNPRQWAGDYPSNELLLNDISNSDSFVVTDSGSIIATFVLRAGEDPTYKEIREGDWLDDGPYATIHRIASDGSRKGIVHLVLTLSLSRLFSKERPLA